MPGHARRQAVPAVAISWLGSECPLSVQRCELTGRHVLGLLAGRHGVLEPAGLASPAGPCVAGVVAVLDSAFAPLLASGSLSWNCWWGGGRSARGLEILEPLAVFKCVSQPLGPGSAAAPDVPLPVRVLPGKPISAVVGTSGSASMRPAPFRARIRTPLATKGSTAGTSPVKTCTSPESSAIMAGAAPL